MPALAVTATIAGARSFAAIGQWAAAATADHLAAFGLGRANVPDESTLRKLFARLDADTLDAALGIWMGVPPCTKCLGDGPAPSSQAGAA